MQMELASTLAKNTTKPNPLKSYHYRPQGRRTIETEETLAGTVVILKTERIKGSNP
jgi:hypothetical protein